MRATHLLLALPTIALASISAFAATPTNDAAAFRRFDLYGDRIAAVGVSDHVNIASYPSFLDNDFLLVLRSPSDSVALFNSEPHNAINLGVGGGTPESYVTFAVTPPQFATSIGLLAMGIEVFKGSGGFDDSGKPLVAVRATFTDGDTATAYLTVGHQIRSWASAQIFCTGQSPFAYVDPPDDPLAGVVYHDDVNGRYYDVQEVQLPPAKRAKRLQSIQVKAVLLDHFCSFAIPHTYAGSRLHGVSAWPDFTVRNALNQPVVRESQNTGQPHGGYLYGSTIVGTRRTTTTVACQVASQAMLYTFAGFNCLVDSLNSHLQRRQGYEPDQVAIVKSVSPTGDAITFRATGRTALNVNDEFLVEHGTYTTPLATYRVTSVGPPGVATRTATHSVMLPSMDDPGRVYWEMIPRRADLYAQSPQLRTIDLPSSDDLAAKVESLLVRGTPVAVNVVKHFVVADGWTSSFRPGGTARGTYSIKDPFDARNFAKMIEGKYRNRFSMARYVEPVGAEPTLASSPSSGTVGLAMLASGARRIEIIDPMGRRMLRDAAYDSYLSEIPGASIEDLDSEHDNGGDLDGPVTGYDLQIPAVLDGHYTLHVYANAELALNASVYDNDNVFSSDAAIDTSAGAIGSEYDVHYSAAGQFVSISLAGTLGVSPTNSSSTMHLTLRANPAAGPVEFVLTAPPNPNDVIEVFDVSGRKVGDVEVLAGRQTAIWDWTQTGIRPGVYLARLRSRPSDMIHVVVVR